MLTIRVRSVVWFVTGSALALVVALLVTQAWSASASPGDSDSTFVPLTTCRLVDTRPAPDRVGLLDDWGPTETKTVQSTGANGNCTVPSDAVGLSLNVTAVNATSNTFLTFWPEGALPLGSSLNPRPGQPPVPNAVTVTLSSAGSFQLYNRAGTVDVLIDVNGYYTKASLLEIGSRLAALETAQPVAMSTRKAATALGIPGGGDGPIVIATVSMTPSVAGQITANSVTNVATGDFISGATTPFAPTTCSITTGTVVDTDYTQTFTPDNTSSFDSPKGLLAGTRSLDVAAGVPVDVNLVCQHVSGAYTRTDLTDSVLTAIFTPAP
jgi:hypothetical protein